ncbi:MAG: alpha-hydroxy-acid oxidizing protein [Actinomycetota bacterium]|nr:alpha-hydroxy-acid oxidizing protein [Actinomycetota bacterium]
MPTKRRFPRWSEVRPLLQMEPLGVGAAARVARAHDVGDLRRIARRRTPRAAFDYVDGGATDEVSMRRARAAFDRVEFRPRVLRNVSAVDTSTTILGRRASLPVGLGPTGFTRMMQHEGERAVAAAAGRAGIPYVLSTMGTTSVEDLAEAAPKADLWFQLYVWRDRERSRELIARAHEAGYHALMLTVDVPVHGARLRDSRNGLTVPPSLSPRTLAGMARFPSWWLNKLTTEPLAFASLGPGSPQGVMDLIASLFDPAVTYDDIAWMREEWDGPLVVKGIQHADDARRVADLGADALVVSNHGGRQLDRAVTPLEVLPEVLDAVGGDVEVLVDGGVRSGSDAVAAVALGARGVLLGRAYLYALMAGGEAGVDRLCVLLEEDVRRTMALLGVTAVDQLSPQSVRLRPF